MNVEKEICVWGIGSVGLATISYLDQNNCLPNRSAIFVKKGLEQDLQSKSESSFDSLRKLHSLNKMKTKGLINEYEKNYKSRSFDEMASISNIDQKKILFILGLGSSSGNFFLHLANFLSEKTVPSMAFCVMPFHFEGRKRTEAAKYQLDTIKGLLDETIPLNNQDLLKNASQDQTFDKAFIEYHELIKGTVLRY